MIDQGQEKSSVPLEKFFLSLKNLTWSFPKKI